MIIFNKEYDGESIVDLDRDISEVLDSRFNPVVDIIPKDEHGFHKGSFVVTVQWEDNPKCCCCGTTENIHKDGWYGYRCDSVDCMVL